MILDNKDQKAIILNSLRLYMSAALENVQDPYPLIGKCVELQRAVEEAEITDPGETTKSDT